MTYQRRLWVQGAYGHFPYGLPNMGTSLMAYQKQLCAAVNCVVQCRVKVDNTVNACDEDNQDSNGCYYPDKLFKQRV